MKGHYERRKDGKFADVAPCRTCKYQNEMTVGSHCYTCIDTIDLALHKPNAETEFANYKPND